MNIQNDTPATALRRRMTEDVAARNLGPHSQRNHLNSCARFAAFLGRSPDTATADDIRRFQLFLIENGASICSRNRIMTGVRFLFRVALRRHDLAAEIYHLKEPQKIPLVMSQDEVRRLLAMAANIKARVMLSLAYGCGLRTGEVVRLRVGDIDSAQNIIRIVQSKGRKDRNVMLPANILGLLRQWWRERPTRQDAGVAKERRWLFPGYKPGRPLTTRQFIRLFRAAASAQIIERAVYRRDHAGRHSRIPRGGLQLVVAEQRLADPNVDAAPQPAGREAVAQRMQRHRLCDTGSGHRLMEEACELPGREPFASVAWEEPTLFH